MKIKNLGFLGTVAIALALAFSFTTNSARAQVALTVSPSVISNTYPGLITLNITGVTSGEKVTVRQWLDLNSNSIIDSSDILFDAFKVMDGGAMIFSGVTNISVPFDSNPTNGAITTTINFAPPLTLENIVGQRIFQVVSAEGTATALMTVTNAATGQTLTGTIYSNGVPFPNAVLVALAGSGQNNKSYSGATIADNSGNYSLNLSTGTYALISAMPGCYFDQNTAPVVTLTNGMRATNNVYQTSGVVAINGQVYDASNTNAIGGLMMQMQSGSLFGLAFTDTNGNYTALVTSNFWKLQPTKERLARRAYLVPQSKFQVDTTAGAVSNANIGLFKANAMFYGRITDNLGNPLGNIDFDGSDSNNVYDGKWYSLPNGHYAAPVYDDGNITNDIWNANPNSSANLALANDIVNNSIDTNVFAGQAIRVDFTALPVTGTISGSVHDNLGNPVVGITLYAMEFNGGNSYTSLNGNTDTNGFYSLGVANGAWQVNFSYGNNDLSSQGLVDLFGPYNVSLPPTNATLNITVYTNGSSALTQPQFIPPSQFNINIVGTPGVTYTLQVATNLHNAVWSPLYTFQITNNFPFQINDPSATNRSRFYRLLKN